MKVSIVIPAYNEEENISLLLEKINMVKIDGGVVVDEIILIDDGSEDKTAEVASKYGCKVIKNKERQGKGAALRKGFEVAKNDIVVTFDADNSHMLEDISNLVQPLQDKNVGLVQASRYLGGSEEYTFVRAIGNIVLTNICNKLLGTNLTDALNGYKAIRKDILNGLKCKKFDIEIELLSKCIQHNYRVVEVGSHEKKRKYGKSNLNALIDGLKFLKQIIKESFNVRFQNETK